MDHFFLRPEQRTKERLAQAGGNVDRERFEKEVLKPLRAGKAFTYRAFDCHQMSLAEEIEIVPTPVVIIEGAYSCHPEFVQAWDQMCIRDRAQGGVRPICSQTASNDILGSASMTTSS